MECEIYLKLLILSINSNGKLLETAKAVMLNAVKSKPIAELPQKSKTIIRIENACLSNKTASVGHSVII